MIKLEIFIKILKKIKYIEIKEILEKNSLEVTSTISEKEIFLSLKTISNSSKDDLSFFSNFRVKLKVFSPRISIIFNCAT